MNKILVKLFVPAIEENYELWIPINKRIYNVVVLLVKAVNELSVGEYVPNELPALYDKNSGSVYNYDLPIEDTSIRNGSELILM